MKLFLSVILIIVFLALFIFGFTDLSPKDSLKLSFLSVGLSYIGYALIAGVLFIVLIVGMVIRSVDLSQIVMLLISSFVLLSIVGVIEYLELLSSWMMLAIKIPALIVSLLSILYAIYLFINKIKHSYVE